MDDLKQHLTVALVTHSKPHAAPIRSCSSIFGELVEVGPAAAMFTAPRQKQTQNYVAGKVG